MVAVAPYNGIKFVPVGSKTSHLYYPSFIPVCPSFYTFAALFFSSTISPRRRYTIPFSCRKGTHSQLAFPLLPVRRPIRFAVPLLTFFRGGGGWIVRAGRVSPSMNSFFQTGFQDSKVFPTLTPPTHSLFKPFLHAGNTFTLLSY